MSEDEHHDELVAALQDVMLPNGIPVLPGIDLTARYSLPSSAEEAAGNWFDVVPLPEGRVALVVGEAVGTGMASTAAMGQLRAIIRAGLELHHDPVAALELADSFAQVSDDARGTAVVAAVLDPVAGTLVHATAGHPPPIVASATGRSSRLLEMLPSRFLGTGNDFVSHETAIGRGDLVLLTCAAPYRLVNDVAGVLDRIRSADLETTGDELLSTFSSLSEVDAVTLLIAEFRSEPRASLDFVLPAGEQARRTSSEHLTAWLEEIDAPKMDALAIVHAAAEIVVNAVEHAHAGRRSTGDGEVATIAQLRITGRLTDDGTVLIEICDQGIWRVPGNDGHRGRGLAMAAGLVDGLRVETGPDGTRVQLTHRLVRPVHIERDEQSDETRSTRGVEVHHPGSGSVSLIGNFGHDDVDRVTAEVLIASRGRTRAVVLDLDQVTRLSSSALRLLDALVAASGVEPIRLVAAPGSAAQRALDVAAVPHHAA